MSTCSGSAIPSERLWTFAATLAPLAGSASSQESRAALAAAFTALAQLLPDIEQSARLLADLNALSPTEVFILVLLAPSSL